MGESKRSPAAVTIIMRPVFQRQILIACIALNVVTSNVTADAQVARSKVETTVEFKPQKTGASPPYSYELVGLPNPPFAISMGDKVQIDVVGGVGPIVIERWSINEHWEENAIIRKRSSPFILCGGGKKNVYDRPVRVPIEVPLAALDLRVIIDEPAIKNRKAASSELLRVTAISNSVPKVTTTAGMLRIVGGAKGLTAVEAERVGERSLHPGSARSQHRCVPNEGTWLTVKITVER
jgi:hypothetical protein